MADSQEHGKAEEVGDKTAETEQIATLRTTSEVVAEAAPLDWYRRRGVIYFISAGSLVCPIFCTRFIVSVARLTLLIDSRSRGCGEVGSA